MDELGDMPRRAGWRRVLWGDEGLRAGWSLLLFVVLAGVIGSALTVALHRLVAAPRPNKGMPGQWWMPLIGDMSLFTTLVLASWIVARVERRPFTRYGLRREHRSRDLLAGALWGVIMLSLLAGALAAAGALHFDGVALGGKAALGYGAGWLAGFVAVGLAEEYATRGFLQYTLARGVAGIIGAVAPRLRHARTIGFWTAAAVFSVGLFAAGHIANAGETPMGLVSVALAGITFAYVLYRTGSLWWGIGFHAAWDWSQSFLYGVRDSGLAAVGHLFASHPAGAPLLSGGNTGPEGSILVVPVLLLTVAVIHRTLPRRPAAFDAPGQPGTDTGLPVAQVRPYLSEG